MQHLSFTISITVALNVMNASYFLEKRMLHFFISPTV